MSSWLADHREHRKNVRVLSRTKIANEGAGQIIVDRKKAYVAHLINEGLTIVDVENPYDPKVITKVPAPLRSHSHKVQISNDIMIVNNEKYRDNEPWVGGVRVFDISDVSKPRELSFFETPGKGVHRMWFVDGKYAHISASDEGYTGQFYMILDLENPEKPVEVSRWWIKGMWEAGGEIPYWKEDKSKPYGYGINRIKAHGPAIVQGDRSYLGWTDGGFTIMDISDIRNPKCVTHMNWCPPFGGLTHTVMPLPKRDLLVVTEEARADNCNEPEKYVWLLDVQEETNPVPISTVQVEDEGFCQKGLRFGPHNIHENRPGSLIDDQILYVTYFNGGLRIIDIQDKYRPVEVGYFIPEKPEGQEAIQTNDVFVDHDGLIHIVDRYDGTMYILEYTGPR